PPAVERVTTSVRHRSAARMQIGAAPTIVRRPIGDTGVRVRPAPRVETRVQLASVVRIEGISRTADREDPGEDEPFAKNHLARAAKLPMCLAFCFACSRPRMADLSKFASFLAGVQPIDANGRFAFDPANTISTHTCVAGIRWPSSLGHAKSVHRLPDPAL